MHSDDEEEEQYLRYQQQSQSKMRVNNKNSKSKKRRKSCTLSRKYKKYTPPKHIQQKIKLHKAIKRLSISSTNSRETDLNETKSTLKRNIKNNNKKQKLSISNKSNNNNNVNIHNNKHSLSLIQTDTNSSISSHSFNHISFINNVHNMQSPMEYTHDDNLVDYSQCNSNNHTILSQHTSSLDSQGKYQYDRVLC